MESDEEMSKGDEVDPETLFNADESPPREPALPEKEKKQKKDKKEKKEKKEKTDKKEKKEKKEKKDKKDKKDKKGDKNEEAKPYFEPQPDQEPSALDLFGASPSPAPLLPEDRHEAPAVQQAPERKKDRRSKREKGEKPHREEKRDKKDKREKKNKKDKKDKKDKKEKKDKRKQKAQELEEDPLAVFGASPSPAFFGGVSPSPAFMGAASPSPAPDRKDRRGKRDKKRKAKELSGRTGQGAEDDNAYKDIMQEFELDGSARGTPSAKGTPSAQGTPAIATPVHRSVSPHRRRRRRRHEPDAEHEEKELDLTTQWAQVMEAIKPRRGLIIKDEEAHAFVESFIQRMESAANQDLELFRMSKPMVKKLELLPEAVEVMEKYQFTDAFITYGGCRVLALWLQHLPNGSLPSVHLRSALLRCMERLPITKDALKTAGEPLLGKIVATLQTHPEETMANRKRAQGLVQRWLRQIIAPENAADSLEGFLAVGEKVGTIPRPLPETEESLAKLEEESAKRLHPAIPVIQAKDYVIQPVSTAQPVIREKLALDTNKGKLNEVLKVMARPNKKAWRPYTVSVAGRQLNVE